MNIPQGTGDEAYSQRLQRGGSFKALLNRIDRLGWRGGKILDAGCGPGHWTIAWASRFDLACGVDLSTPRLNVARWIAQTYDVPGVSFTEGDITKLPYPDDYFDAAFCYGGVIDLALRLDDSLREFKRVVVPGAPIYISINGIGWSYHLRDSGLKEVGCRGIYNTLCQTRLPEVRAALMKARPTLKIAGNSSWAGNIGKIERSLGVSGLRFALLPVAQRIADDCGPEYAELLVTDLAQITRGSRKDFSHSDAHRGYDPEEVSEMCRKLGLVDYRWAEKGQLKTGEIPAVNDKSAYMVWEFTAHKPASARAKKGKKS